MLKLKIVSPERIEFDASGEKKSLDVIGGFVEVQKNVVSLCVEIE